MGLGAVKYTFDMGWSITVGTAKTVAFLVGMRLSVQDILYLVAKQGECHRPICKVVRKPAAFAEYAAPSRYAPRVEEIPR